MNTQPIEQLYHWALQNKVDVENNLKEEKEKESRYFLKGVDSAFGDIIVKIKEALASLPTAQPTEVYIPVEEGYTHFVYNANEADRVKKAKAILIPE